jgi:predicted RNA-binding Zn ribbon-like protein
MNSNNTARAEPPSNFGPSKNTTVLNCEFLANALCLDFLNSVEFWQVETAQAVNDFFLDSNSVLQWCARSGVLELFGWDQASLPRGISADHSLVREAQELRQLLYRVFNTLISSRVVDTLDLEHLSDLYQSAHLYRRLGAGSGAIGGPQYELKWIANPSASVLLQPIIISAVELLLRKPGKRLHQCQGSECGWFFLDTSKNGTRRWCDMRDCGNRAKAKRHYARARQAELPIDTLSDN